MANSIPFMSLPAEVRDRVYSYVLPRLGLLEYADGQIGFAAPGMTQQELFDSLAICRVKNAVFHAEVVAVAFQHTALMSSGHSWPQSPSGIPHQPDMASALFHNVKIMMLNWQAIVPPRKQLFPQLQTLVDPRITLFFAESRTVPLRDIIIRYMRNRYLHPNGELYNQGWVTPFFNGFNHPTDRARIWVRIELLSFAEGTIDRLPETPQEWETHAGDMEWLEEIWLCLDDNRLVSRHYTAEELRMNGPPGLWQNKFQEFWYDTLV